MLDERSEVINSLTLLTLSLVLVVLTTPGDLLMKLKRVRRGTSIVCGVTYTIKNQ